MRRARGASFLCFVVVVALLALLGDVAFCNAVQLHSQSGSEHLASNEDEERTSSLVRERGHEEEEARDLEEEHAAAAEENGDNAGHRTIMLQHNAHSADDHEALHQAAVESTVNSVAVPLHNVRNRQYIGAIKIGSDKQELNVIFDTGAFAYRSPRFAPGNVELATPLITHASFAGSSNFWITWAQCRECAAVTPKYRTATSTTHKVMPNSRKSVKFGTGLVVGPRARVGSRGGVFEVERYSTGSFHIIYHHLLPSALLSCPLSLLLTPPPPPPTHQDVVTLGTGATTLKFTQDLLLIHRERGRVFATSKFSGICGLGFPELAFPDVTPLFDSMMKEHPTVTSFSFFFSDRAAKKGVSSELHFGPPRSDYYVGCLQYLPVTKRYYWETRMQGIFLLPHNKPDVESNYVPAMSRKLVRRYFRRRDDITSTAGTGMKAAVDSGTSLMAAPRRIVRSLVRRIKKISGVNIMNHDDEVKGCNHAKMPEIVFRMGLADAKSGVQVDFVLHPEDYFPFRAGSTTRCWSGIMSLDVPAPKGPLMVLGDGEF